MGNCRSSAAIRRQDCALVRTSTFVRYAMLGDLVGLKLMLTKDKMDPNAQDVRDLAHLLGLNRALHVYWEANQLCMNQRFEMTALHWGE